MKKKYITPEIRIEPIEVEADYALGCGTTIGASTVSCLEAVAPNEYEELVYGLDVSPSAPLEGGVAFSSSSTCLASCYQGPYDTFFNS